MELKYSYSGQGYCFDVADQDLIPGHHMVP